MARVHGDVAEIWFVWNLMLVCLLNGVVDSDVISLNLTGDTVIVLNSLASVDALLEDKSAIYSDRYCDMSGRRHLSLILVPDRHSR